MKETIQNLVNLVTYTKLTEMVLRNTHWSTDSYAEHKNTDQAAADLIDKLDTIVELSIGRYEELQDYHLISFDCDSSKFMDKNNDEKAIIYVRECIDHCEQDENLKTNSDILNALADLRGVCNKFLYLSRLV